jgi:hypothetical protein
MPEWRLNVSTKAFKAPFAADWLTTGRVIPGLTALIGALVVFSGLLPLQWFHFQDYQVARQVLQWRAPFIPNLQLHSRYYQGGEIATGNLRQTEFLGWRTFSTDPFGFRYCPPVSPGKPIEVDVFRGLSFVWGVGLSDEETFPAQLARATGMNTYNSARFLEDPETPEDFDHLMAKVGAQPKTIVYVHLEPNAHVLTRDTEHYDVRRRLLWFAKEWPMGWLRLSPAIATAVRAKKALENDVVLHNRYRENVTSFTLPNGQDLLVKTGDLERAETNFDDSVVNQRADFIAWWGRRMAERGARMIVLLVPDKISVYGPQLGVKLPEDPYLDRMARNLETRGLHVVNGLTVLRKSAASDLSSGQLAYRREDEHWNPTGVARLVQATAEAMDSGYVLESSKAAR